MHAYKTPIQSTHAFMASKYTNTLFLYSPNSKQNKLSLSATHEIELLISFWALT